MESITLKRLLAGPISGHHAPVIYCLFKKIEYLDTTRSVLYSRLPAQFFGLSLDAQGKRGEIAGLAIIAEKSLIKVLLFMVLAQAVSALANGISSSLASRARQLYTNFLPTQPAVPGWSSLDALRRGRGRGISALWDKEPWGITVPLY